MADGGSQHQKQFDAAVKLIQSLPNTGSVQPSNEVMLRLYGFFKQATRGPCNISRPSFWDPLGRQKWDAWNALSQMSKEEAMAEYVNEIKQILEMLPITDRVEEFLLTLGPFYEIVDNSLNISTKQNLNLPNISDYPKYLSLEPNDWHKSSPMQNVKDPQQSLDSKCHDINLNGKYDTEDYLDDERNSKHLKKRMKNRQMNEHAADSPAWGEHNGFPLTATTGTALKSLQKDETNKPKMNCLHQDEHLQHEKSFSPERSLLNLPASGCTQLQGVNFVADTAAKGSNPDESKISSFTVEQEPLLMLRHVEGEEGSASDEITISLSGKLKRSAIDGGVILPHFTGDSDSEHYCDSMEHLNVEEATEGMEHSRAQLNCPVNDETKFKTYRGQQMLLNGSFRPPHFERKSKMIHSGEGMSPEKNGIHYREGTICASQCIIQLHGKEILNEDTEKFKIQAEKGQGLAMLVDGSMEEPTAGTSGSSSNEFDQSRRRTFNISKQITITLQRLQEDMERVLRQLGSLEALVSSQAMSALSPTRLEGHLPLRLRAAGKRTGLSRLTLLFLLAWPFFAQWIVRVILKRRRKTA
ncbi:acyl-CoA-binding domain-containing protein 5-like [Lethenteron reissneri]|uniref:acyl-CoA-binding domain-containing protein 5-like n=1 Tax=Lethenteron reissneri TaxID=7753 RepID=UPI002AB6FE8D|nr:acyl-CoA-binding domain-containing protein 5-like [Lethenteron reissneri]